MSSSRCYLFRLVAIGSLISDMKSESTNPTHATAETPAPIRSRQFSGSWLVIGLLCLGIAATALMFVYWDQHTRPFRTLREAIGKEFRHSRPNVEGGRHKGRGPWTLRISMSVDFPPAEDSPRANQIFHRVLEIARQHHDLKEFEKIEVNLIQFVPQELAKVRKFTWTPQDPVIEESPTEDRP